MDLSEFKPIDNAGGYFVDRDGNVVEVKIKHIARSNIHGYPYVRLGGKQRSLARIVARAFLPVPNMPSPVVTYRDGNPANVSADNLVWVERPHPGNNMQDHWEMIRKGLA